MSGEIISFRSLPIGAHFTLHGHNCVKRARGSATVLDLGRTFFFTGAEIVGIGWAGEV